MRILDEEFSCAAPKIAGKPCLAPGSRDQRSAFDLPCTYTNDPQAFFHGDLRSVCDRIAGRKHRHLVALRAKFNAQVMDKFGAGFGRGVITVDDDEYSHCYARAAVHLA